MTQVLLRPSDTSVNDDQDEQENENKEHTANESDEPCLRGELLHAKVITGVGKDDVDDIVGVHAEHEGSREGSMTQLCKCCSSYHIDLM